MSAITTPPKLLTIDEYVRTTENGKPSELVRGRIVDVPPTSSHHGFFCGNVLGIIRDFVLANRLGRVLGNDPGVITERDPDTVRGADVALYSFTRVPPGPMPNVVYFEPMPELVFEILSPSERWSRVLAKVTEYLTAGVTVVCVVNPRDRTATVYRDQQDPESFPADSELTIPDVLPGFQVNLRRFFE